VVLFNYRLWWLATRETFSEREIGDIEPLYLAFKHDLHKHRNEIDVKFAKVALRMYLMLEDVLVKIGIDLLKGENKEVTPGLAEEDKGLQEELPPYTP
jgi:hypothetical protein